jgi:hypothetical protein
MTLDAPSVLVPVAALGSLVLLFLVFRRASSIRAIPLADAPSLRPAGRRTAILRAGLVLLTVLLLSLSAMSVDRPADAVEVVPAGGGSTVIVLDYSASVSDLVYSEIARTFRRVVAAAGDSGRVGLVVFSDVAQVALPPDTSAAELRPFIRFFLPRRERGVRGRPVFFRDLGPGAPPQTQYPLSPWFGTFSGGTRISTGLAAARELLARTRASNARVVLLSDLANASDDMPRLVSELIEYRRGHIDLGVIALPPAIERDKDLYRRMLGTSGSVTDSVSQRRSEAAAFLGADFPTWFAALAVLVGLAVAANEVLAAPLRWRLPRSEGAA